MAEADRIMFDHQEVLQALIKKQGLHEGRWQLVIEFGLGAGNAGPDASSISPAAIIPVLRIGLRRTEDVSNITADAAEVNPKEKGSKRVAKSAPKKKVRAKTKA